MVRRHIWHTVHGIRLEFFESMSHSGRISRLCANANKVNYSTPCRPRILRWHNIALELERISWTGMYGAPHLSVDVDQADGVRSTGTGSFRLAPVRSRHQVTELIPHNPNSLVLPLLFIAATSYLTLL